MKTKRLTLLVLMLLALASPCFAQSSKVALVDTSAFSNSRDGISRLVQAVSLVDREFETRRAELNKMYARLENQRQEFAFVGPIPTDPRPMTPERRKEAKEKAEEMRLDFELKQKVMLRDYDNRMKEVTAPIHEDIRRSLKAFAESRGIAILIDASSLSCPIGCNVSAAADLDITREFIAEYNRLHP